jgi:dynein heavy chain
LETKRLAFPRFYFLSNDDLLQILSQTRNPHAVQPHLRKCFDNINRIKFTEEEDSREVRAMVSAEPENMPEEVAFNENVIISEGDKVENWLKRIEETMITSLRCLSLKCYHEYPHGKIECRKDWMFADYPSQSVLLIEMVRWQELMT